MGVPGEDSVWGTFSLGVDATSRWQIGPLSLWIKRTEAEWRIASLSGEDPLDARAHYAPDTDEVPPEEATVIRCAIGSTGGKVQLVPTLADRPVVVRPGQPFTLLPNDGTAFYVGSQMWLRIQAGDPPQTLADIPTYRLSDTWFGASTREGELCYASRTQARMLLAEVPILSARALTHIHLRNSGHNKLVLERLKVPVSSLDLFLAEDGRIWTNGLVVQCAPDGVAAEVRIEATAPAEAGPVVALAPPRTPHLGVFQRALGALIG